LGEETLVVLPNTAAPKLGSFGAQVAVSEQKQGIEVDAVLGKDPSVTLQTEGLKPRR
jgi:hypothetical protein